MPVRVSTQLMTAEEALALLHRDPGHEEAWENFYRQMYRPLLIYVRSLLLNFSLAPGDDAHDVVHDALTAFWQRWAEIRKGIPTVGAAGAYLRKTCRNLLVDQYRHRKDSLPLLDFLTLQFSSAFANQPELYRGIFLREIIARLPSECASMLRRYVEDDLSPAEIADREGASVSAFYARWYRCLQKAKSIADERNIKL